MLAICLPDDDPLDALAKHCIVARDLVDEAGTTVMRRLVDLLLFEIGVAIAERDQPEHHPGFSRLAS
ncbi:hypothetical protein G3T14_05360 [Methylobacterium sp. BTF04]|nr:hypothetical protein [Methylobacterium sp. BTF04]